MFSSLCVQIPHGVVNITRGAEVTCTVKLAGYFIRRNNESQTAPVIRYHDCIKAPIVS